VGRDGQVTLEDLQSANGVFVNGIKLSRPSTRLSDGDSLLFGTTEISVFALRPSTLVEHAQETVGVPLTRSPKRPVAITGRSDALDLVGQFAEKLMESGHPHKAARVLSEHLLNLLRGASAGLGVSASILERATLLALRLRMWTQNTEWVEYVLQLHLACLQVPSKMSLDDLEPAVCTATDMDLSLLGYFVKTLERRPEPLTPEESLRLRRINHLAGARAT
jgi:hypothetical protein